MTLVSAYWYLELQLGLRSRACAHDNKDSTRTGRRLQNLEASLGVKLVERTTCSIALTTIWSDFLPHDHRLLTELQTGFAGNPGEGKAQRGYISIACVPTVGLS